MKQTDICSLRFLLLKSELTPTLAFDQQQEHKAEKERDRQERIEKGRELQRKAQEDSRKRV